MGHFQFGPGRPRPLGINKDRSEGGHHFLVSVVLPNLLAGHVRLYPLLLALLQDDAAAGVLVGRLDSTPVQVALIDGLEHLDGVAGRSEERRVGQEWVCTCRYGWSP